MLDCRGIDLPFFLIACNGEAGLWKPERVRLDVSEDKKEAEVEIVGGDGTGGSSPEQVEQQQLENGEGGHTQGEVSWLKRGFVRVIFLLSGIDILAEGAGPFKDSTFAWYWVYMAVNSLAGQIMNSFQASKIVRFSTQ